MGVNIQKRDGGAVINITGEITSFEGVPDFAKALGDVQQIEVFIDSFGGCSSIAFPLHDVLKEREATAHILNRCWSAAAIIAAGCKNIRMARGGSFLVHEVRASCFGTREKMLQKADWLKDSNEQQVRIFSNRSGCSHELVRRWLAADTVFTAEGALRVGLVDEIFDLPAHVSDFGGALPSLEISETCDESKAALLKQCLAALGTITTANRAALVRDIQFWMFNNVQQFAVTEESQ
jgi:ATP-dependent protease ClpP protease subunit